MVAAKGTTSYPDGEVITFQYATGTISGDTLNQTFYKPLRGIAVGRRAWTFAGSQRGADRCAAMLTLITTCRLNDVDPKAWLADVLARIADMPRSRLHELLPWQWKALRDAEKAHLPQIAAA